MPDTTANEADSPDVDEIVETLNSIQRNGHSPFRVYRDWVDLMLYALQRDDEQYLEVMDHYDNDGPQGERPADLFARAFGKLRAETAETGLDVLGDVYEAYGMQSDQLGQHFTPHTVVELLAELSDGPDEKNGTVSDPACGSGRMLVYTGQRHSEAVYLGQDQDAVCAKMTALNLCLFNLDGYVVHGDTLKMEQRSAWRVISTSSGGVVREVPADGGEVPRQSIEQ